MLYIILVELCYPGRKILGCGMRWDHATRGLGNLQRLTNVINVHNLQKIDKELRFIRWGNYIIQWAHNLKRKLWMHLK